MKQFWLVFVGLIVLCQAWSLPEPTQAGDTDQSPALKASARAQIWSVLLSTTHEAVTRYTAE